MPLILWPEFIAQCGLNMAKSPEIFPQFQSTFRTVWFGAKGDSPITPQVPCPIVPTGRRPLPGAGAGGGGGTGGGGGVGLGVGGGGGVGFGGVGGGGGGVGVGDGCFGHRHATLPHCGQAMGGCPGPSGQSCGGFALGSHMIGRVRRF